MYKGAVFAQVKTESFPIKAQKPSLKATNINPRCDAWLPMIVSSLSQRGDKALLEKARLCWPKHAEAATEDHKIKISPTDSKTHQSIHINSYLVFTVVSTGIGPYSIPQYKSAWVL